MAQTLEQFGQTIKAKYPQYKDISDVELGQKMLTKYPQYKDMVSDAPTPSPAAGPFPNETTNAQMSEKIQNFFPGRQVGQAIGTLAGYGITAGKEALGFAPKGATAAYDLSAPSPLQVAGDVAKGASMIAGLKVPIAPAASLGQAIIGGATRFGALGALTGAGEAATQTSGSAIPTGADLGQVATKAFWSGLTSAAIGGVTGAATYGLQTLMKKGPEALYNNAINVSKKIKAAGKSPAGFLQDEGVWGGLGTMSKTAEQGISDEGAKIAQKVADASTDTVNPTSSELYSDIKDQAVDTLKKKFGNLYSNAELSKMVDSVPLAGLKATGGQILAPLSPGQVAQDVGEKAIDLNTVNKTREQLGRLVGDTKWLQTNPTENTSAAKAVYGALADYVKENSDTAAEFARQSQWIESKKAIGNALLLADKKWLPGFYDWTSGAVGSALGLFAGNPVAGGLTGVAIERATRSPAFITGLAQGISKLPEATSAVAGQLGQGVLPQVTGRVIGGFK